ncbi:probable G-protein coupled receptor 32 [Orycteropus afer afer]|uniref:Probable G-protein coupled receptor 32 n=1 Tax=Orycteropus afer afer TaxID=1230840 RepID=A0A8B7B6K5_ORYAF|nr:probable G-protein coupled receptor 32 [Orycteropus afer afer]
MTAASDSKCQPEEVGYLRHLTITVLCVSCVIGSVANGLVLWMTVFRMPRTVTTVWFLNLALADFAVLLSLPFSIYILIVGEWPFHRWVCKLYQAFLNLTFFTSICLLVLISVDRCISVLYPIWTRNHRTVRRAKWLAASVWLLAALTCVPYLIFRTTGAQKNCTYCYFNFSVENGALEATLTLEQVALGGRVAMTVTHLLLGFLLPLVVIGICAHLIRANFQQQGWIRVNWMKRLLLMLVTTFFVCWFPFTVALCVQLWRFVKSRDTIDPQMLLFLWAAFSLGCLNSCLNPFLYVLTGRDFKKKFLQSIPSALARAFGEEDVLSQQVSKVEDAGKR